jgi:Arc/MetJ-type ribon-helix-helix transcriptional regulator
MTPRTRLSASVEAELLAAGRAAVAEGRAGSLSAWVNEALRRQSEHDLRMAALDAFLAVYEAEHGEITPDEIEAASRRARSRAVVVRPDGPSTAKPVRRARRGVA